MKRFIIILPLILILFVFISQCTSQNTSQKIVGHRYEVRGQYYDYDPTVPLINQTDEFDAIIGAIKKIKFFNDYNNFYNQCDYQCFSLKNEGTAALTTAQSAAAGTTSREQLLNFHSIAKDTVQREENCQESIRVFQTHQFNLLQTRPFNQLYNELDQNMQISMSDENKEITNYNIIASNFNNAIIGCPNNNQVVGIDGFCHNICVAPNIYCV
jgi:hypothetical protein